MLAKAWRSSQQYSKSSWEQFYSNLLSSDTSLITPNLNFLVHNHPTFDSNELYFDIMFKLCVEECRATICQELLEHSSKRHMFLLSNISHCFESLFILEFRIVNIGTNPDLFRNGCIVQLSNDESNVTINSIRDVDKTQRNDDSCELNSYLSVLALSERQSTYGQDDSIRFVIHDKRCKTVNNLIASNSTKFSKNAVWTAQYGGNILSLERMARVCIDSPCVAFVHKLTGGKAPTHTKFEESDDMDGVRNRHVNVANEEDSDDVRSSDELLYDNVLLERVEHRFFDDSSSSSSDGSTSGGDSSVLVDPHDPREQKGDNEEEEEEEEEEGSGCCGFVIDRSPDSALASRLSMGSTYPPSARSGFTTASSSLQKRVRDMLEGCDSLLEPLAAVGKKRKGTALDSTRSALSCGDDERDLTNTTKIISPVLGFPPRMIAPCLSSSCFSIADENESLRQQHLQGSVDQVDALVAEVAQERLALDSILDVLKSAPECSRRLVSDLNDSQVLALRHCTVDMITPHAVLQRHDLQGEQQAEHVAYSTSEGGLYVVQGPPGCGKTHVLSALLHVCAETEQRVLVCASSNKAVCVALQKYLSSGGGLLSARLAIVGVEEKIDAYSTRDRSTDGEVLPSLSESEDSSRPHHSISDDPKHVADIFAGSFARRVDLSLTALCSDVRNVDLERDGFLDEIQKLSQAFSELVERLADRIPQFVQLTAKNAIDGAVSCFSQLVDSCALRFSAVDGTEVQSEEEGEVSEQMPVIQRVALECDAVFATHTTSIDNKMSRSQVVRVKLLKKDLLRSLRDLGAVFADATNSFAVSDEYVQSADFLFCTLSCAGNASVTRNFRNIDLLVVDEAAQAFEPELLVPMALLPKNLVLLGDPMQLPATVVSQELRRLGLDRSVMQRLMMGCRHPFCLLDTQYRMHPTIAQFSSQHFYRGRVKNAECVSNRASMLPSVGAGGGGYRVPGWLAGNCSFLDIEGSEQRVSRHGSSLQNLQEAQFIAHLLKYLRDQWAFNLSSQICVISFYAAQVQCIKDCVVSLGLGNQVQVLSVDSFQGSESDCVILSFVRSNAQGEVGFIKEFRRLNVALTRAQRLMLSVGSARTLESLQTREASPHDVSSSAAKSNESATDANGLEALREMMIDLRRRN